MKIVIVGGGIAGLTTYLALQKHLPRPPAPAADHEYRIYEPYNTPHNSSSDEQPQSTTHSSTLTVGGGLGVGPNGLHVLHRLNEDLLHDIVRSGYIVDHSNLKSKHGHLLLRLPTSGTGGQQTQHEPMHMLAISRHALWSSLRRAVPDSVLTTKRVSHIATDASSQNLISFTDNSNPEPADLVIGADGLKSTVKHALLPDTEPQCDAHAPHYEGLVGVGGFLTPPKTVRNLIEPGSMNFLFSGNGFFGYFWAESAPADPQRDSPSHVAQPGDTLAWWATYAIDPCPSDAELKRMDPDTLTARLRERYSGWSDPVVCALLQGIRVQSVWPTWTAAPLASWARDSIILVGDAAHALPSTSGQGASQALEDAEALGLLLRGFLERGYQGLEVEDGGGEIVGVGAVERRAVMLAGREYDAMRRPRVEAILRRARRMQDSKRDMGVVREYIMYVGLWVMGFFPGVFERGLDEAYEYDLPGHVERVLEESSGFGGCGEA
ncbi:FAD/NAD(P)-binding domain-containing protein [Aspergillus homomorphus CBS 101889]|uniref:FAD/NAD(P)-binding domain-containing protein n=1 Tax=Aspergillus homomorphus (strain CBS 101889) TaxID=1450537 RepID=A0A395HQT4_ASPHC|nr:FAD/NAD(P)-binding domain-containing protein [Aspergillus homomorphus CBS 101889]RAL10177.1 FAD/NAD(P)-binding domain-containing protein [Aspergillus homomorphus CBS 101889]